ncbi:MAG: DMT family transporter, partial [Acetobacteraceae bacterium]
ADPRPYGGAPVGASYLAGGAARHSGCRRDQPRVGACRGFCRRKRPGRGEGIGGASSFACPRRRRPDLRPRAKPVADPAQSPAPVVTDRRLGLAMVFISTLAWSTAGLFIRAADTDLATIIFWRGIFGVLGMTVVLLAFQGRTGLASFLRIGRAGWAYVLVSVLTLPAYLASLHMTSIAHVAIIYATVPLMTAFLAWVVLREAAPRSAIAASVVAVVGAVLMVGLSEDGTLVGDALALGMTFGMAVMVVLARRNPEIPALAAGTVATALTVLAVIHWATATVPPTDTIGILAIFGLSNSLLGFALFILGSRRIPAVETALIGALEAPIAPVWVWLMFGETPGPATVLGGIVVFAAVFWHILHSARG